MRQKRLEQQVNNRISSEIRIPAKHADATDNTEIAESKRLDAFISRLIHNKYIYFY